MLRSLYLWVLYPSQSYLQSPFKNYFYCFEKEKHSSNIHCIIDLLERQDKPWPITLAEKTPVQPKPYLSLILYLMHCQDNQILQRAVSGINYTHSLNNFDYQLSKSLCVFVVEEWESLHKHYFHITLSHVRRQKGFTNIWQCSLYPHLGFN